MHSLQELRVLVERAEILKEQCQVLTNVSASTTSGSPSCAFAWKQAMLLLESCKLEGWMIRTLLRIDSRTEFNSIQSELCYELCSEQQNCQCLSSLESAANEDKVHLSILAAQDSSTACDENSMLKRSVLKMVSLVLDGTVEFRNEHPAGFDIPEDLVPITDHIESGGRAAVYKIRFLNQELAVKRFQPRDSTYKKELRLLLMKHPNVLSIIGYSFHREDGSYSILMEKLSRDLAYFLERKRKNQQIPLPVLVSIMFQIAKGIHFLHSQGMLHLDLKPSNVLVVDDKCDDDMDLVVKVGDFDASKLIGDDETKEERHPKSGSIGYRAPEKTYTTKLDVFSYGMTCYYMLAGAKNKFDHSHPPEFDQALQSGNAELSDFRHDCPREIAAMVTRCTSIDPEQRPSFNDIIKTLRSELMKAHS